MPQFLRRLGELLILTARRWNAHNAPQIGAALAFYTTFSMAPLLVIAIAIAGKVFGEDAARIEVGHQVRGLIGTTGAKAVEEMITNAHRGEASLLATVIGTVTLLIGASSVFGELQNALNLMWNAPPTGKITVGRLLRERFLSFAMVLIVGFLLLVSLLISAILGGFQGKVAGFVASPVIAQSLDLSLSILVTTTLFAMIYKVLPDVKISWGDVWLGALVTAVLFAAGKQLIGLYLGNSTLASSYGAAGSFAVMLMWIYYSAQLLLMGAEFTQVWAHRNQPENPLPIPHPSSPPTRNTTPNRP